MASRRLFLGRKRDGTYISGMLCPVRQPILGGVLEDIYPEHGDPLVTYYTAIVAERYLGRRLDVLEVTQIEEKWTELPGPRIGSSRTYT